MAGFPNVPFAPGVPPLLRAPNFATIIPTLLSGDVISAVSQLLRRPWGLYQGAIPVIFAESVMSLDFRHDAPISDYPVENGGFASFNKVRQPFQGRVRFMMGGTQAERTLFIATVQSALNSLALYDLVMPEAVYPSVNVVHYDFSRRADKGNGLLTIDVWCEQVSESAEALFSQTQSASGANAQNNGTVQTVTVTPAAAEGGSASVPFLGAIT